MPRITYIWREDRLWHTEKKKNLFSFSNNEQNKLQAVIELYTGLHEIFPTLEFQVVGLGKTGRFPEPIRDLRQIHMNDQIKREWCRLYSQSICVIGVHGSNMLLPSALAGSVVELVPLDRWGNLVQDILAKIEDVREALYRIKFIPLTSSPALVSEICASMLTGYSYAMLNFQLPWSSYEFVAQSPNSLKKKYLSIKEGLPDL